MARGGLEQRLSGQSTVNPTRDRYYIRDTQTSGPNNRARSTPFNRPGREALERARTPYILSYMGQRQEIQKQVEGEKLKQMQ